MSGEKQIIDLVLSHFPPSGGHLNRFFESDAEILEPLPGKLLFTTDEFSSEDFFQEDNAWMLGWNLACCTISDILASGGDPVYFAHALTLAASWDQGYIGLFSKGIADALHRAGAGFIGGDLGTSPGWKYTGICLGSASKPLTRRGACAGESIYMTGNIGGGNLMAALKLFSGYLPETNSAPKPGIRLPMRVREARFIRDHAHCCIDTSDGVLNALNVLADINEVGYAVHDLPYLQEGLKACSLISHPKTILFAGECGEYELLFTLGKSVEKDFLMEARKADLQFVYLGEVTATPDRLLKEDGKLLKFNDFDFSARGYKHIEDYLVDLTNYLNNATGPG